LANPHKGEIEIKLIKSKAKGLLKTHNPIRLKFDYNALADAELEFKDGATMVQALNDMNDNPLRVSLHNVRILLEWGLKHQFPTIDRVLAGRILEVEDFTYMTGKLGEAINLGFEGNIITEEDAKKGKEFVRSAEELEVGAEGAEEGAEVDDGKN